MLGFPNCYGYVAYMLICSCQRRQHVKVCRLLGNVAPCTALLNLLVAPSLVDELVQKKLSSSKNRGRRGRQVYLYICLSYLYLFILSVFFVYPHPLKKHHRHKPTVAPLVALWASAPECRGG